MYFTKNSRYVLRRAQWMSPTSYFRGCTRGTIKNLCYKSPKDDPSKPPLRLNIPGKAGKQRDSYSDVVHESSETNRNYSDPSPSLLCTTNTFFTDQSSDGLINLANNENELEIPYRVEKNFQQVNKEESSALAFQNFTQISATHSSKENFLDTDAIVSEVPFKSGAETDLNAGSVLIYDDCSIQECMQKDSKSSEKESGSTQKNIEKASPNISEDDGYQKALYIIIDIPPKNADAAATRDNIPEPSNSKILSTAIFKNVENTFEKHDARKVSKIPRPEGNKAENSVNNILQMKNKNFMNQSSKSEAESGQPSKIRFHVHEIDEAATHVFHLKLKNNLRGKSHSVGCVPEKDFKTKNIGFGGVGVTVKSTNAPIYKKETSIFEEYKPETSSNGAAEIAEKNKLGKKGKKNKSKPSKYQNALSSFKFRKNIKDGLHSEEETGDKLANQIVESITSQPQKKTEPKAQNQQASVTIQESQPTVKESDTILSKDNTDPVKENYFGSTETSIPKTDKKVEEPEDSAAHFHVQKYEKEFTENKMADNYYQQHQYDSDNNKTEAANSSLTPNYYQYEQQTVDEENQISATEKKDVANYYQQQQERQVPNEEDEYINIHSERKRSQMQAFQESNPAPNLDEPSAETPPQNRNTRHLNSRTDRKTKNEKSNKINKKGGKGGKGMKFAESSDGSPKTEKYDPANFQTSGRIIKISSDSDGYPMKFCAAFPPSLNEVMVARSRALNFMKRDTLLSESLKKINFSSDSTTSKSENVTGLSENSILFPKEGSDFDCDTLFCYKKNPMSEKSSKLNDNVTNIPNESLTNKKEDPSVDSLTMMKKVKEIVNIDLDNAVKIFEGRKTDKNKDARIAQTGNNITENSTNGDTEKTIHMNEEIHLPKYLPGKNEDETTRRTKSPSIDSVIVYNDVDSRFELNDLELQNAVERNNEAFEFLYSEAIAKKLETLISDHQENTFEFLSKFIKNHNNYETKGGDSILVYDEITGKWKVDFGILERREEQLRQEEELTRRSELILDTIEKIEKRNISSFPKPNSPEKKIFDYTSEEWKTYKPESGNAVVKNKRPFKESNAEEIRKKNSDLYENLFITNKRDIEIKNQGKEAPGINTVKNPKKKEAKQCNSMTTKSSDSGSKTSDVSGDSGASKIPSNNEKGPCAYQREDCFWESYLNSTILPFDMPEKPKPLPKETPKIEIPPTKLPPVIPTKKIEDPKFKIPLPFWDKKTPPSKEKTPLDSGKPSATKVPPNPASPKKDQPPSSKVEPKKDSPKKGPSPPSTPAKKVPPPSPSGSSNKEVPVSKPPSIVTPVTESPPKSSPSAEAPAATPPKGESSEKIKPLTPPKVDFPKSPSKASLPKIELPKNSSTTTPPKEEPPKESPPAVNPPKGDPPKKSPPTIGSPNKVNSKMSVSSSATKIIQEAKEEKASPIAEGRKKCLSEHYISENIVEMSRSGKEINSKSKKNKIETVKLNITSNNRMPSKITEINLNRKTDESPKDPNSQKKSESGEKKNSEHSSKNIEKLKTENRTFYKNFEKYKTPFSDPEYEEKSMKINTDIESNPNLKKLDNWSKTLVLHDIMKPPENIESWLKEETDKMATLLLKVLQEAAEGKPKKKPLIMKTKSTDRSAGKGNPYDSIRKKQETNPESFLFKIRSVNLALEKDKKMKSAEIKKLDEVAVKNIPLQSAKTAKPSKVVDAVKVLPEGENAIPKSANLKSSLSQAKVLFADSKPKLTELSSETMESGSTVQNEQQTKLIGEVSENIPGPEILKKISSAWKLLPVIGCQMTIFTLLRMFQLVNLGSTFFNFNHPEKSRSHAFSKLFAKYGPIVNLQGPLSGNVVLIHKPEHLSAVFEQDPLIPIRSIFDSLEYSRREAEGKIFPTGITVDWLSSEWNNLRKCTTDPLFMGSENFFSPVERAGDALISNIRRNRNSQNMVSEDFMNNIKRWSLEGICNVIFTKSFKFLESRGSYPNWLLEPDKLFMTVEEMTQLLSNCERGFQMWRLTSTPSLAGLEQAYRSLATTLSKQIYQAEITLKKKNEHAKDDNVCSLKPMDLTFIESMLLFDGMTPEEATCNLVDIILVGTNTMNSALGFLLYNLAQNVKVQQKLVKEVKELLPDKNSRLEYKKLHSFKYLHACLKESLRLFTPFPLFFRLVQNDILLSNYIIPKGAYLVMDSRVASMKEHVFDEPEKFVPERWLKDEQWIFNFHPFASFPLCHGPRSDLAKRIVEMQLCSCIAKIVRNFEIEYHFGEISGTEGIISLPNKPLKFNFIERNE